MENEKVKLVLLGAAGVASYFLLKRAVRWIVLGGVLYFIGRNLGVKKLPEA